YLGPPEEMPPFPAYPWTTFPDAQIGITKVGVRTNFLQAVEGSIDSAHSWYLHPGSSRDWDRRFSISRDLPPRPEAEDTAYGFRYAAIRVPNEDADKVKYVRVTLFAIPSTAFIPPPLNPEQPTHTQIFVPMDDAHTMLYDVYHSQNGSSVDQRALR